MCVHEGNGKSKRPREMKSSPVASTPASNKSHCRRQASSCRPRLEYHKITLNHPQVWLLRGVGGANEGLYVFWVLISHTQFCLWSLETLALMQGERPGRVPRCIVLKYTLVTKCDCRVSSAPFYTCVI